MKILLILLLSIFLYSGCGHCASYPFAQPGVKNSIRQAIGIQCPDIKPSQN